jgi:hypothetical protein
VKYNICDVSVGNLDLPTLNVECPCQFTQLPGLGAGISKGYKQHAEARQVTELNAVPDTQLNQIWQTNCCECAESADAALAIQAKNRTFTIQGSISVLERVYLAERELPRTPRASPRMTPFALLPIPMVASVLSSRALLSRLTPRTLCPSTQSSVQGTHREKRRYCKTTLLKTWAHLTGLTTSLEHLALATSTYLKSEVIQGGIVSGPANTGAVIN